MLAAHFLASLDTITYLIEAFKLMDMEELNREKAVSALLIRSAFTPVFLTSLPSPTFFTGRNDCAFTWPCASSASEIDPQPSCKGRIHSGRHAPRLDYRQDRCLYPEGFR